MQDNDGFKFLKDAFAKFAAKYDVADVAGRAVRSLAAGGKAAVDRGLQEFPKAYVSQLAKDVYTQLASQEMADGISSSVRSFDEAKIQELVDKVFAPLKNPDVMVQLIRDLKSVTTNPEDALAQIEEKLKSRPMPEQLLFGALINEARKHTSEIKGMTFDQFIDQIEGLVGSIPGAGSNAAGIFAAIRPILSSFQYASDEEIAQGVADIIDLLHLDQMIVSLVAETTRNFTPEQVSKQTAAFVGKLPSPQAVSDIVHNIGGVVSQHLDQVSQVGSASEAPEILRKMAQNVKDVVTDTISQDKASKNQFNPKSGKKKFDF